MPFVAYSVYAYISSIFATDFLFPFQRCIHHILAAINTYINSIRCTIIPFAVYSANGRISVHIFLLNLLPRLTLSPSNIKFTTVFLAIQTSSNPFARWCPRSFCCLFSLWRNFLCVSHLIFHLFPTLSPSNLGGL